MELEMDVEDLLNKRKLESDRIEFKAGWNPDDIYHSVCAFANDYNNDGGGYIVVGVEEENGVAKRPVKGLPEYMLDSIQKDMLGYNNLISPPYFPQGIPAEVDGKWIFVIQNDKAVRRNIQLNRENQMYYEVVSGLKPNEKVIVSDYSDFKNYEQLNIKK